MIFLGHVDHRYFFLNIFYSLYFREHPVILYKPYCVNNRINLFQNSIWY